MSRRLPSLLALSLAGVLATTAPVLAETPAPAAQVTRVERTASAPRTVEQDAERYAEREKPAQEQKDYEGGDYVVIGVGAGTLIIALLLIIILL